MRAIGAFFPAHHSVAAQAAPALFVILWSTGFIAARYGLPYAPPLRFLLLRFTLVAGLMTIVAVATGARWPRSPRQIGHLVVASWLVNGVYLGGVFISIAQGMPAGTSAMVVGLQPVLTVFLARAWLGERVSTLQWIGLGAGLAGVWLVVRHRIGPATDPGSLLPILAALVAISVGTLYQKRYASSVDLRTGAAIQFAACAAVYLPLVIITRPAPVDWTAQFAFALAWSVIVLSAGAISLLYWLLRRGAAADVAGLFYLVPPVTAAMAWWMFDETLGVLALAGMVLIAIGVLLARRRR